jgi:hypothetical protein
MKIRLNPVNPRSPYGYHGLSGLILWSWLSPSTSKGGLSPCSISIYITRGFRGRQFLGGFGA